MAEHEPLEPGDPGRAPDVESAPAASPRRAFLLRLARASVWAAPAVATLRAEQIAARGAGGAGGGKAVGQKTAGGLSPVSQQQLLTPEYRSEDQAPTSQPLSAPWNSAPGTAPPWSRPPVQRPDSEEEGEEE